MQDVERLPDTALAEGAHMVRIPKQTDHRFRV